MGKKIPGFVIGELSEEWKSTFMEKLFKHTENLLCFSPKQLVKINANA